MSKENIFADGFLFKTTDTQPDWVVGSMSIKVDDGYTMRLFLPNYEGNMSVKWLRRLKVTDQPAMTKDETSKYTELMPDGRAAQFTFTMGVKSVITRPSKGYGLGACFVTNLFWRRGCLIRQCRC